MARVIAQLDEDTQKNAQRVEEASAGAEALREQAADLRQAVSAFRVGGAGAMADVRVAPAGRARLLPA